MITIKPYEINMHFGTHCIQKEFPIHMLCSSITTLLYTRVRVKNVSISIKNKNDLNMKY